MAPERAGSGPYPVVREDIVLVPPEFRQTVSILLVVDDQTVRESCRTVLEAEGYRVQVCGRGDEAQEVVRQRRFDIVLLDLYMGDVSGMDLLRATLAQTPETIVIMMTGNPSIESNIEALRAGAWDYITKPFTGTHMQILFGRAAHTVLVARESLGAHKAPESGPAPGDMNLLGADPAFERAVNIARRVAITDASVFITGESGTGKEMIAQFIHRLSRRSARPLVAVNCAALPEGLLESEMFGHEKGAFTGAVKDKVGLIETASGGTLLLDELVDMPKPVQAKLLRVIQDGVVRRVGSSATRAVANVRFISASNRDPEAAVKDGTLREDLYYRLRVVPIHVPPLRERPSDVRLLAEHFLQRYWRRHREPGSPCPRLPETTLATLARQPWPGNVRQLQNVIEHAVVMLEPGREVQFADLAVGGGLTTGEETAAAPPAPDAGELSGQSYHAAREQAIEVFERRYLSWLLGRAGGNMSRAARLAGVDRTTLYRLMQRHGLQREVITVMPD